MTVDGPIMALTNLNNKRLVDVVSLSSDRKCIQIQANTGPQRLASGRPASSDVVLNGTNYPTICPKDNMQGLTTNLVIIQVKALDFSRNGKVDLLVSLAPETYQIDRAKNQVTNILYFQVGEERENLPFSTFSTLFPTTTIDFYSPIQLPTTPEPLVPLLVNEELFAPDLLFAENDTTIRVLINALASYTTDSQGNSPFSRCLQTTAPAFSDCFRDEVFYTEEDKGVSIAVPLDISQVDLSGNCKPEVAIKLNMNCPDVGSDSILNPQLEQLSKVSNQVLTQNIPYNQNEICSFVRVLALNYTSSSSVTRYEPAKGHSIFLGAGVGMLTFTDINNNAAIDVVFSVCRRSTSGSQAKAADCLLENSVHILYNKQMHICNSGYSIDDVCRGKSDMCVDDPKYAFNTRDMDIVIYPLPSFTNETTTLQLNANIDVQKFNVPRITAIDYRVERKVSLVVPVSMNNDNTLVVLDLETCNGDAAKMIDAWESKRYEELNRLQDDMLRKAAKCPDYLQISSTVDYRVYPFHVDMAFMDIESAKGAYLGNFVDFVGNGHTNFLVNIPSTSFFYRFSLPEKIDGYFLKVSGLSDLCLDSCRSASPRWSNVYYATSMPGTSVKYVSSSISSIPAGGSASQYASIVANPLMPPYTFFGVSVVAEYIDVLFVGNIFSDEQNFMHWTGIVPNSYAAVSQYPPDSSSYWVLNSFLPDVRGTETFVVVFALCTFMVFLTVTIILHCCELKRDKQLESKYSHSLYRSEL